MPKCAYGDLPCQPTREHVIPRWYNDTPGEAETFSARAPITHLKGDLMVKDVCRACNGGVLATLDAYGKLLYESHFSQPIYFGETVSFDYDGGRLLRWLLKLSHNSARAQNADSRVLREFRNIILGKSALTDRIRCWLHLVTASCFDGESRVIRPARREEQGHPNVDEARWFRICQFRLPSYPAMDFVQRTILIDSFAFTLLIAPWDLEWRSAEFDEWTEVFLKGCPSAKPIFPATGCVSVAACDHAAASIYPPIHHFPIRFAEEQNSYIVQALKDDLKLVFLSIPRGLIEEGDTAPITSALRDMVFSREKATAFRQRVGVMIDGFDDDPRPLWLIPESRHTYARFSLSVPLSCC